MQRNHIIWTLFKSKRFFFGNTLYASYHSFEQKNDLCDMRKGGKILKMSSSEFHTDFTFSMARQAVQLRFCSPLSARMKDG
jgi:hypothetical protein